MGHPLIQILTKSGTRNGRKTGKIDGSITSLKKKAGNGSLNKTTGKKCKILIGMTLAVT